MQPIRLTRKQVREVDRIAIEEYAIPGIVLMENAARGLAEVTHQVGGERMLIVCGAGNNAGDGYAAARHLANMGHLVTILPLAPIDSLKGDALTMARIAQRCHGVGIEDDHELIGADFDVIVDAILGTGLSRAPEGRFADAIEHINARARHFPVIAADVPSGLDCDTGEPLGACVRATRTVTFVAEKIGFANPSARQYTGDVTVADIGAPSELVGRVRSG